MGDDHGVLHLVAVTKNIQSLSRLGGRVNTVGAQRVVDLVDGQDLNVVLVPAELDRLEGGLAQIDTPNRVKRHLPSFPLRRASPIFLEVVLLRSLVSKLSGSRRIQCKTNVLWSYRGRTGESLTGESLTLL